eukprot:2039013-Karenia_brevis.AAC.1
MFLHAFNIVLDNFDLRCDEAGLTSQVGTESASEVLGIECPNMVETKSIAYVDDVFKPIICDACLVVESIVSVSKIAFEAFRGHGFQPNFKA